MTEMPLDVLENALDSEVEVRLKDGDVFEGRLRSFDQHMNLVLEDAVRNSDENEGTTIIRGDNVVSINP
ncbi:MAG: LSM domain-containing protein [Halobacteria archaeon]|nr:LSM domain-containing protein [Halobacteria archaeon]